MAKLARIAGIDMLIDIAPYGKVPLLREKYLRAAQTLLSPLYHIKRTFPIAAAGVYPGMVPKIIEDLGSDCIIGVGGAIHGHPMGGVAGAKAMRQAIEATLRGVSLEEYAKTHEELRAAIDAWGIYDPKINIFKAIKD
jgi:2,3-diketo-5-methylthiopentyl-1-phosphate enolase